MRDSLKLFVLRIILAVIAIFIAGLVFGEEAGRWCILFFILFGIYSVEEKLDRNE